MAILNDNEIIATYESVWEISRLMLDAAKNNYWDDLPALEKKRYAFVEKLMKSDQGDLSDAGLNAKKTELIQNILESDAKTKELTELWMVELRQIIGSVGAEKKLNNVYANQY